MKVLSNKVIYHDGRHNAFTSLALWKGKYWLTFRNGTHHRSEDGRIMVMNSANMENWSVPQVAINTKFDDRDPALFVCDDKLFVVSMSADRKIDEANPFGQIAHRSLFCLTSSSNDGENWTEPQQTLPKHRSIWWVSTGLDSLYSSVQVAEPINEHNQNRWAELWRSNNGLDWEKVSIISDEHKATEVAMAFLPDKRLVAFVRHDDEALFKSPSSDSKAKEHNTPEIKIASPPYTDWKTVLNFDFRHNGPCIGLVGDTLVTASRAFFEDPKTPLADDLCRQRIRGMILGTLETDTFQWTPSLVIPHSRGVAGPTDPDVHEDASMNWPDVSYASIMDLGGGKFAMTYYEGLKGPPCDIRVAILIL